MEYIVEFDEKNFGEVLKQFSGYRKCFGLLTAGICDLPIVKRGFVFLNPVDEVNLMLLREKYGQIIMCRIDSLASSWHNIPRGRDIGVLQLSSYYEKVRNTISPNIIFLCFQHPSIFFTGNYIERYNISGAYNALIVWGEKIIIEYVGKGFDVGDLTRGILMPHQNIEIPWECACHFSNMVNDKLHISYIDKANYTFSRERRIAALAKMGYDIETIMSNIPSEFTPISFSGFLQFYKKCIAPVLYKHHLFTQEKPITILVNVYGKYYHVFEVFE